MGFAHTRVAKNPDAKPKYETGEQIVRIGVNMPFHHPLSFLTLVSRKSYTQSVILPTHGRERKLADAVDSLNQTTRARIHLRYPQHLARSAIYQL